MCGMLEQKFPTLSLAALIEVIKRGVALQENKYLFTFIFPDKSTQFFVCVLLLFLMYCRHLQAHINGFVCAFFYCRGCNYSLN